MFHGKTPGYALPSVLNEYLAASVSGQLLFRAEGEVTKTINIWRGRVTSASSQLMDDRLGEVIYREGKLTLDTFIDAAGKVTKALRFGELLIKSGIFTPLDLFDALTNQTRAVLASLLFYPILEVEFRPNETVPKLELPINETLGDLLDETIAEFRFVQAFERAARLAPSLTLNEDALHLANNDFHRDVVQLVRETPNFSAIVDKTSRLSAHYTMRALFELYLRGVLEDSWGFARSYLSSESASGLTQVVEEANFLLAELANAAKMEEIEGWENIVFGAGGVLSRELGSGHYLTPVGFVHSNILRSSVLGSTVRKTALSRFENRWPTTFVECVRNALHHGLVYILFELFNRKFSSQEFARVRVLMEDMRGGKGS